MTEPTLPDKVIAVHAGLTGARVAHAFGGALALAYYAEPRVTIDIDVNIFMAPEVAEPVWNALGELGADTHIDRSLVERDGQCRIWWGRTPLDLFFAYDAIHDAMRADARTVPFGDKTIPILAPEHLAACKVAIDRAKDWIDLEQMLVTVEHLDTETLLRWVDRLVGEADSRYGRLAELIDRTRGS